MSPHEVGDAFGPKLHLGKLRLREITSHAPGYMARKWRAALAWRLHSGTAILSVDVYVSLGECWNAEAQSEGPGLGVRRSLRCISKELSASR